MLKNVGVGLGFVLALTALCIWAIHDRSVFQLGIDLRGGTELLYQIVPRPGQEITPSSAEDVKSVLSDRLDTYGLKELPVTVAGRDRILIEVAGTAQDVDGIKRVIEQGGNLEFHIVSTSEHQQRVGEYEAQWQAYIKKLEEAKEHPEVAPAPEPTRIVGVEYKKDPQTQKYDRDAQGNRIIDRKVVLENTEATRVSGEYLKDASAAWDQESVSRCVAFRFNTKGAKLFLKLTEENVERQLAIVLDGQVVSSPGIREPIFERGQITGNFSEDEVKQLVTVLKGGSLPADLVLESEQTIGSALGKESIVRGMQAMIMGLALVIVFMAIYYFTLGIVADIALLLNLLMILTGVVAFRNTLTFPGMAGLLLTIGMSVDANILVFERMREEASRGRSLQQTVTAGFQRAFSTIFDSNLTTILTAYVLFQFGSGPVKGFAIILTMGLVCSFFTAIYVSRLIISALMKVGLLKRIRMMALIKTPKVDFLKWGKHGLGIGLALVGISFVVLAYRGQDALGLDFTGGARVHFNLNQAAPESRIREAFQPIEGELGPSYQIQTVGTPKDGGAVAYSVRTGVKDVSLPDLERHITEVLQKAGLLAPAPFSKATVASGRFEFIVRAHEKNPGAGTELEKYLSSRDFGKPQVENFVPETPELGAEYVAYRVSVDFPEGPSEQQFTLRLQEEISKTPGLVLSRPFESVSLVGSKVAQNLQGKFFIAVMLSFAAVIFYMALRFELKFGIAAVIALICDAMLSLGTVAVADWVLGGALDLKINLPVVAAILTIIGYSLNDKIVIFDRVRENLVGAKRDVDYVKLVNDSINQTLSRTILTGLTVIGSTLILLIQAGPALHAFSFTLFVGLIVGTISTMYIASPALIYLNTRQQRRRQAMLAQAAA